MDYNNIKYMVFPTSQLYKIDFSQVYETSANTVRVSIDETKTFVKWDQYPGPGSVAPSCLIDVTGKEGPYTHEEITTMLQTPEWKNPLPSDSL